MSVNWLNSSFNNRLEIIENEIAITSSTTLSYTGVSFSVTAGRPYVCCVNLVYANGEPKQGMVSTRQTQTSDFRLKAKGINMSICGKERYNQQFYIFARYANSSANSIRYALIYL